jgi:hypothetical protein
MCVLQTRKTAPEGLFDMAALILSDTLAAIFAAPQKGRFAATCKMLRL